jgi:hypothetical protein
VKFEPRRLERMDALIERVDSGRPLKDVAAEEGVSIQRLRELVRQGRRWRRVPDDPRDRVRA